MAQIDYELEIMEFRTALRDRTAIPGDNFRQPEFQDVSWGGYLAIDEGSVSSTLESRAVQSYLARYFLKDHVYFAFGKRAFDVIRGGATLRHVPGGSVMVAANTSSSIDVPRSAGHATATASVFVQRDYLVDFYGLNVDNLPERCRNVFRGVSNSNFVFDVVLSSRSWLALDAVFRCRMTEPLKSIYLKAKYQELLLETIDMLNRCEKGGLAQLGSPAERERQMIEAAALMYRRDLQCAPSVSDLARTLGMDSGRLTDGFKDIFGLKPEDYATGVRLDWAKEQLAAGAFSVEEAAQAVGYPNSLAFARAYGQHFGKSPSGGGDVGYSFSDALLAWSPLRQPVLHS